MLINAEEANKRGKQAQACCVPRNIQHSIATSHLAFSYWGPEMKSHINPVWPALTQSVLAVETPGAAIPGPGLFTTI
eukprot:scaffold188830_cov12-Tisochrysis_lutea.AAC.1